MATHDDAPAVAAIYGPFCESTPVSFEFVAPSVAEMARRIEDVTADYPWLVLDDDGAIAGYAYAGRHRDRDAYAWSVDTTVYVGASHLRRGVGRALYTSLFAILRLQGYFRAYAGVTLPNPASTGLHEAMGFTPVGVYERVGHKQGVWHDVLWYQLALGQQRGNPATPLPVRALIGSSGWAAAVSGGLEYYRPVSPPNRP